MAKITNQIPKQGFERLAARVAELLYEEIQNQVLEFGDYDLDEVSEIAVERNTPVDVSEDSVINISLASGTYGNKNQGSVDGTYILNIDTYSNSANTDEIPGDKNAALKNQKIMGVVRYILEHPSYRTLGFAPPFIMSTLVQSFDIKDLDSKDARNNYMSRIQLMVKLNETTAFKIPDLIEGYDTHVKIGITDKGYYYVGENY